MPEAIDELFVKLGLEQDEEQFKQAQDSFDNLRGAALQFGAVIGAGFGLNELTFDFARTTDEINKLAQEFQGLEVSPQFVDNLQGAFRLMGDDASNAEDTIRSIAQIITDTDWGEISDTAFKFGFDVSEIRNAENARDVMLSLNRQLQEMNKTDAREMGEALGLSSAQIRMFRDEDISARMSEAEGLSPLSKEMSQAAEQFQDGFNQLSEAMTGLRDEISAEFVGDLGEGMSDLASTIADNRKEIVSYLDQTVVPILNSMAYALATQAVMSGGAAILRMVTRKRGAKELAANAAVLGAAGVGYARGSGYLGGGEDEGPMFLENQGFSFQRSLDALNPFGVDSYRGALTTTPDADLLPRYGMQGGGGGNNITINVDAKNSQSPEQTRKDAERGTLDAINKLNENTLNDLRPFAQ